MKIENFRSNHSSSFVRWWCQPQGKGYGSFHSARVFHSLNHVDFVDIDKFHPAHFLRASASVMYIRDKFASLLSVTLPLRISAVIIIREYSPKPLASLTLSPFPVTEMMNCAEQIKHKSAYPSYGQSRCSPYDRDIPAELSASVNYALDATYDRFQARKAQVRAKKNVTISVAAPKNKKVGNSSSWGRKKRSKVGKGGCSQEQTKEATKEEGAPSVDLTKKKKKKKEATTEDKQPTTEGEGKAKLSPAVPTDKTGKEKKESQRENIKTVVKTTIGAAPATKVAVMTAKPDIPDAVACLIVDEIAKILISFPWYHGLMPRDEISDFLQSEGDFLVRKTDVGGKPRYAVSVMSKGRIRHILLNYKDGKWWLKDLKKSTLNGLIDEHVESKTPIQADGAILIKAVARPEFYVLHEHIEVGKKLGGGAFGDVHIGKMTNADKKVIDVAVKKLKGSMNKKQRAEFMKEAKLMRRFDHPNIINLIGIAPQEDPVMIILELATGGCLKNKLQENPSLSKEKLTDYTVGACRGMCYLAARKVIHRDIAARNCLLGPNDEVKISDFGLSVADKSVLKLDKLKSMPIKWLAPEVLRKGEFSTKTDVWSFGVMIWEIFSHCKSDPFPGMSNADAKAKILSKELPMTAPEGTPEMVKVCMVLCFTQDTDSRPDFEGLFRILAPKETPPPPPPIIPTFETYDVPTSSPAPSTN